MTGRLEGLRRTLDRQDAVIFVGSGVSCWSGLPTWKALLEQLAEFMRTQGLSTQLVQREIEQGDLLQAASYGFYQLSANERTEFLKIACKVDSSEPSELHKVITNLGPKSYITTNYDKLLERALGKWRSNHYFQIVGNWGVLDVANVTQAASSNFVFKPHGDIDNSESIILTREDYRSLHGNRRFVFEGLKTLLATRPMLFIGFGLRDPDFLLMKDLLAETYPGGLSDHYAVVANVDAEEVPYWRENFGIHLVGYETSGATGNQHYPLIELLNSISGSASAGPTSAVPPKSDEAQRGGLMEPDVVLRLVRHCARMQMIGSPLANDEIPLRLRIPELQRRHNFKKYFRLDGGLATEVLRETDEHLLLIAPPGAGKTFTLQSLARTVASETQTALLEGAEDVRIPVYAELKSYAGDLWQLVQGILPVGLDLDALTSRRRILLLLDGANEIENRYFESGEFSSDLSRFIARIGDAPLVLASRSDVGLGQTQLVHCLLDEVDSHYIEKLFDTDNGAILSLLQKPLFLRLAQKSGREGHIGTSPHDLYLSYFKNIQTDFECDFGVSIDFTPVMAGIAFELVDEGRQTFVARTLIGMISDAISAAVDSTQVLNWLIQHDVLVPLPGSKLSFAHHTITEYLAAYQLAQIYTRSPHLIRSCLSRRSWDVAILLTLGFLPDDCAKDLYARILQTEPSSALRALDYVESKRGDLLYLALTYIAELDDLSFEDSSALGWILERLRPEPDRADCIEQTWRIVRKGGLIGGAASSVLMRSVQEAEAESTAEILITLALELDEYNFSSAVGRAVGSAASTQSVKSFLSEVATIEASPEWIEQRRLGRSKDQFDAVIVLGENLLKGRPPRQIAEMAEVVDEWNAIVEDIVLWAIRNDGSLDALQISAQAIQRGNFSAVFVLYCQVKFHLKDNSQLEFIYSAVLLEHLYDAIRSDGGANRWSLELIQKLCQLSGVWKAGVRDFRFVGTPLQEILFSYAVNGSESSLHRLREYIHDRDDTNALDGRLIASSFETWAGHEDVLLALLKIRDSSLAAELLSPSIDDERLNISIAIGEIDWWIDWLCESHSSELDLLPNRLGGFVSLYMDDEASARVVMRFNSGSDGVRKTLSDNVLNRDGVIQFNDLESEAISWLVADLGRRRVLPWNRHLLGVVSTEDFIESVLMPMMSDSPSGLLKKNLGHVLRECGRRHGRRYVSIADEMIV
ncbi:SIR2 family protein [Mycobacteroides abscessus subsp. massiliense]|uniref:SIR2 family protein n=1 Tax=Mycobacteroides abscessus TaxID=36809 RepID=UPI0019D19BE3|nr:SIR2 family protein [Mycobacteroides abscessus]MBN7317946.1 SIR2 family protein [Mycobacteroides abscessus subsp. massiliense]